jgi:hypothetical protein
MQRWVLQQNIMRFQRLLGERTEESAQRTLRSLLLAAQRDLAFIEAASVGVATGASRLGPNQGQFTPDPQIMNQFLMGFSNSPHPSLAVDTGPGLHILAINKAYAQATMTPHASVVGKPLFEIFPDNPGDPSADGVSICMLLFGLRGRRENPLPCKSSTVTCALPTANLSSVIGVPPIRAYDVSSATGRRCDE